jgi:hypothetical protein
MSEAPQAHAQPAQDEPETALSQRAFQASLLASVSNAVQSSSAESVQMLQQIKAAHAVSTVTDPADKQLIAIVSALCASATLAEVKELAQKVIAEKVSAEAGGLSRFEEGKKLAKVFKNHATVPLSAVEAIKNAYREYGQVPYQQLKQLTMFQQPAPVPFQQLAPVQFQQPAPTPLPVPFPQLALPQQAASYQMPTPRRVVMHGDVPCQGICKTRPQDNCPHLLAINQSLAGQTYGKSLSRDSRKIANGYN